MKNKKSITVLVIFISIASIVATSFGIFSNDGFGQYEYESIRGQKILIYGKGLYQHMSADVAIQGIAQDYITLFAGVPLLLISLFLARKNSLRGMLLFSGTLGYFLVTYLFYLSMGMYNMMFLVYAFITDYFFKKNFEGFWIGAGLEYWDSQITYEAENQTASYNNTVFTLGGGYVWKFYNNFYLNPWVAFHYIIAGDKEVQVGRSTFKPNVFTPEASIKIGWYF